MNSLGATIKRLLAEDESATLDFKREQYPFESATDEQKGELIKDIMAFANTSRERDAFIVIGVTEGHPATVTGITHHLRDGDLQQFVNAKTNRPVEFSYLALRIEGKQIGALRIPRQPRPVYLRKSYGKIPAHTVYVRHGSSTSIASPDEVAAMRAPDVPVLDLQFADSAEFRLRGTTIEIESTLLRTPTAIPDFGGTDAFGGLFNRHYYRELIRHTTFHHLTKPISVAITNTSGTTALDVRITLNIRDPKQKVTVALAPPPPPERFPATKQGRASTPRPAIAVQRISAAWRLTATIKKIQPRATEYLRHPIYIGAQATMKLYVAATIHADNIPAPFGASLVIHIAGNRRSLTLSEAIKGYGIG